VNQSDERYWIRLLPWRNKNKGDSKSAQIRFEPKLGMARDDGWVYLILFLVNRSSWPVWVEEASVVLTEVDAIWQTSLPTGCAKYQILQQVAPKDTLGVSLARTIYDAAGRPQERYSCFVSTSVRYRVFGEWCNAKLDTYRLEMAALTVLSLRSARWYDKEIKRAGDRVSLTTKAHKG